MSPIFLTFIANYQQAGGLEWPSFSFPFLLATLALTAFILLRRYRSRRQLMDKIAELETLSDAGRAIVASQLDLNALCEMIARQAANVIDTSTFQIGLFEGPIYKIHYWTVDGEKQSTPRYIDLSDGHGLIAWVRDSQRSLLVEDFQKEMEKLPAQPRYNSENPPRSAMFIPLVGRGESIGILAAQSATPKAFSQRDLSSLTILANQASAAIENAQIYEQERTRAAHLELVGQIARQVSAINDLDELLYEVVHLTQETFDFGSVNVFTMDPRTNQAVLQASTIQGLQSGSLRIALGEGLVGSAATGRVTALSNNTGLDRRFIANDLFPNTQSEICIPLIVDQELMGVLDVQSPEIGAFTNQERMVLEALAAQVAIAVNKAGQLALQREQSWLATAQLQVAETINRSPDINALAESLVRLTAILVGVNRCAILLWDEESSTYFIVAAFGYSAQNESQLQEYSLAIGDWTALDAVHIGGEPLTTEQKPPWQAISTRDTSAPQKGINILLPMISAGRVLGILLANFTNHAYESLVGSRQELLKNLSNQAAQAIENMQLQIAQQEEAWVNTALLQVSEAVNRLTDLDEILYTIVRMVPLLVGVRSAVILIRDEQSQTYLAGPSHGLTEMSQGLLRSFEVDLSEFPLLGTQDVERIGPDAEYYTFKLPQWMDVVMGAETADIFPLRARGKLVGVLVVGPTRSGRPLTGRRLNIVTGIAQQAAIAVVNDQLYKESAERSRMEQELEVARSIQASLIPDGAPDIPGSSVASYWQAARQVSGDFYDFMQLADGRWAMAIADVADKGVPAALFMALSRTILRTVAFNRRDPAEVLQRTNQLIYGDTSSDLFVTVFYAVWDHDSNKMTYASGGHNPPVLVRRNGKVSLLSSDGIALGVLDEVKIDQNEIKLRAGDVIVFYTDGVSEAMNEDYDEFGLERLCMLTQNSRQGSASDIVQAITRAVDDHAGGTPQFDDITLVVFKCITAK